ncbi:MAG: radical SAM protein [Roseburia sp.]|nr:radical SAM protein [Anaeroplasma bactoclasticum]MCM1195562.1 radical SAM protein [Roseburia sp.]MCM1555977.1 radical SAM protein [Anaeroplasma bactoclasticum]
MQEEVIVYDFGWFNSYYNKKTGKFVNIKKEDLIYKDDFFIVNDFYVKDVFASSNPPTYICINLTSECNLRCKYCFNEKHKKMSSPSIENIKGFIDKIIEWRPNSPKYFVDMSGSGEALLELDKMIEIANYCKIKSNKILREITPMFVTNGILLTRDIAEILQKNSILFGISLDGYKELHDMYRLDCLGKATYDKIYYNLSQIEDKTYIGGAMTIFDSNTDILKAYQTMTSLFNTVSIKPSRMDYSNFDFSFIVDGYKKTVNWLLSDVLANKMQNFLKIINGDDFFGKIILKVMSNSILKRRCDAGVHKFALGFDGTIYSCSPAVFLKEFAISNHLILPKSLENSRNCNSCDCINICGSLCYIQNHQYENNSNLCQYKKEIFKLAVYFCASVELTDIEVYKKMLMESQQVIFRNNVDKELSLIAKTSSKYTYTKLKFLKDKKPIKYARIKRKFMLRNNNHIISNKG